MFHTVVKHGKLAIFTAYIPNFSFSTSNNGPMLPRYLSPLMIQKPLRLDTVCHAPHTTHGPDIPPTSLTRSTMILFSWGPFYLSLTFNFSNTPQMSQTPRQDFHSETLKSASDAARSIIVTLGLQRWDHEPGGRNGWDGTVCRNRRLFERMSDCDTDGEMAIATQETTGDHLEVIPGGFVYEDLRRR